MYEVYLIKDKSGRYLKTTVDKTTFTTNEVMADTFNSQREATDYIHKRFPKRRRRLYKIVFINDVIDLTPDTNIQSNINYFDKSQQQIDKLIQVSINPEIEKYRVQLIKYDDMILDIRHYIRDETTKANACWGYKIFKALQDIERKRAECKKELQRIVMLKNKLEKALIDTKDFDYEPYKYREIQDINEYINNPNTYQM